MHAATNTYTITTLPLFLCHKNKIIDIFKYNSKTTLNSITLSTNTFFLPQVPFMAISVVCPSCQARFNVSDKFAGQTGHCPKCKNPIKIPKASGDVTIHEPTKPAASSQAGHMPTVPIVFKEESVSRITITLLFAGSVLLLLAAYVAGKIFDAKSGEIEIPFLLQAATAVLVAIPCAKVGYTVMRDKELEPYQGRQLVLRVLVCSVIYASLWFVRGMIGIENPEIWQWLFLAPVFLFAGGFTAVVTFDLDWGVAVSHYTLYVILIALVRYISGLQPPL